MDKKRRLVKISLSLCIVLFLSLLLLQETTIAKPIPPSYLTKLTLENNPQIGGIAILKLEIIATFDKPKVDIGCFLPEGLELVKDKKDRIIFSEPIVFPEKGKRIVFYSGPMKNGEKKEFVFKVRILDGRKYIIGGGSVGKGDYLEIDIGDSEPPEWKSQDKERAGIKDGKRSILSGIKQIEKDKVTDLEIPEDSPPSLRTELRIRTKDKPYIKMPYNPQEIPLRYLVYTEEETKKVEVTVELPEGLELINDRNYKVIKQDKLTKVKLFQGSMRFKECKAFYFKVRSDKKERFRARAQTKVLTTDGRELITEDYQDIELGRVLY